MAKTRFLLNSSTSAVGRMTPMEQRAGRYMRAPDHPGGTPAPSPAPSPTPTPSTPQIDIPQSLPSVDGLPSQIANLYVKQADGTFKLDDVGSLRSTLGHIKSENAQIKGKLTGFTELDQLGLTVDQIKQLKSDADAAATKKTEEEGNWNALKQQMEANFETERSTFKDRETKLTNTVNKLLVDDATRAVLAD